VNAPGGIEGHHLVGVRGNRVEVTATPDDLEHARAEFERRHCIKLAGLLAPDFLDEIRLGLPEAVFSEHETEGLATYQRVVEGVTFSRLVLLANDDRVRSVVAAVASTVVRGFYGRVYRRLPGHRDDWHADCVGDRALALSLNLSEGMYEGGTLEIRSVDRPDAPAAFPNDRPGDALLFRIRAGLEHRQHPVNGNRAKTAFSGWFHRETTLTSLWEWEGQW
jgi:hypothetical protein